MLHGERGNMDIIRRIPKTQKVMKKRNKILDDKYFNNKYFYL